MRFLLLLLPLLLAACAAPSPPKPKAGAARPPMRQPVAPQPQKPRWQAVPAKADGVAVPGGRRHIVKSGETGIAIARAYGVNWSRIAAANSFDREAVLQVGQAIFIPMAPAQQASTGQSPRPAPKPGKPGTPEQQAAAFSLDIDDVITGSAPAESGARQRPAAPAGVVPPAPVQLANVPPLAWPTDGRVILSRFGPKSNGRVNDGISIKTLRGAPVRSAADGEVLYVGDAIASYGLMMLVRHPGGTITAYGHLEDALADRGAKVQRGQPIARAGSSGSAHEPQLLFQVRQGRRALDPLLYLPK
ncbi:peptidoglycan DD-metalloendopeptidase family protein [Sandaracinobacteroides hominis]|uniref:peptidoglycan DD-metalloendopeptidase family protein n=1 Tax=Sandaracinobacteroides hominis TaxID=2780086 RepID=UPI0018F50594|nr:M23 family metallopeptidase [Sandaracinobacteroides hominis]